MALDSTQTISSSPADGLAIDSSINSSAGSLRSALFGGRPTNHARHAHDEERRFVVFAGGSEERAYNCNILPSGDSSSPISPNWENIPETIVFNGFIGTILFLIFLALSRAAWRNIHDPPEEYVNQGIVSFLYGYRDPERWYVMPRFEFLRGNIRHHRHDAQTPKIYVPPKLPLANPIELFAYDSHMDGSGSGTSSEKRSPAQERLIKSAKSAKSVKSAISGQSSTKSTLSVTKSIKQAQQSSTATTKTLNRVDRPPSKNGAAEKATRKTPLRSKSKSNDLRYKSPTRSPASSGIRYMAGPGRLDQSFFYPSILSAEQLKASMLSRKLNHIFQKFFSITDADIIYAKGIDAYEYLLFQRHLILILLITSIFCVGVILPVNWYAGKKHVGSDAMYATSFQRTTINNMGGGSIYYWVHLIISVIILLSSIFIMRSYQNSVVGRSYSQVSRRTLLIGNLLPEQRNRLAFSKVLEEYFPMGKVEAIQFVYDTVELESEQSRLDALMVARDYCSYYKRKYDRELMVKPTDVESSTCRACTFLYICCAHWPFERAQAGSAFYREKERECRAKIGHICEELVKTPGDLAFVTFKSHRQAKRVMEIIAHLKTRTLAHRLGQGRAQNTPLEEAGNLEEGREGALKNAARSLGIIESRGQNSDDVLDPMNDPHIRSIRHPRSTSSRAESSSATNPVGHIERAGAELTGPVSWSVRYAPHPDNVEYQDLMALSSTSTYTIALWHLLILIIFIFITTPGVLLSIVERWSFLQPDKTQEITGLRGTLINYSSILLQIATSAVLPGFVSYISRSIPYEDTSSKNHAIMWKVYLFLVLMVIVMPSLGMASAHALINSNIDPRCWFPVDNSAFFINYVISSIFLTTTLELLKPTDIVCYFFVLWTSRSVADFESSRQMIEREFSVGMQHTGVLLVFTVVMTYTISCPLIAPIGLLYLITKHAVDHYQLFYHYSTKKVDGSLAATIQVFVKIALIMMLFQFSVAISLNTGISYYALTSQIIFCLAFGVLLLNFLFNLTSETVIEKADVRRQQEFCACFYLPRAMEDLLRSNAIPNKCISTKV